MYEKYLKDLTEQFYTAYFRILDKKKHVAPLEPIYYLFEDFGDGYILAYSTKDENVGVSNSATWEIWVPANSRRSEKIKTFRQKIGRTKDEDLLAKILGAFTKEFVRNF